MATSIGGAFAIGEETLHSKVESLESTLAVTKIEFDEVEKENVSGRRASSSFARSSSDVTRDTPSWK